MPERDGVPTEAAMSGSVEVIAPAKVNLALLVGPPRSDRYHEVFSLMVPVTLADTVVAEPAASGVTVDCDICPGADNLAARAVRELERLAGRRLAVHLAIRKRIPHGAGLGGGSSDAAAALRAVTALHGIDLPRTDLYAAAAAVGSDVPFFLWHGPQLAMGRGNVLRDVELPGHLNLVLAVPDLVLPTLQVYRWRDEDTAAGLQEFVARAEQLRSDLAAAKRPADVAGLVANDLEPHVVARHPEVAAVKTRLLEAGALAAAMSGSGSSVFGLFADADAAGAAAQALRAAARPERSPAASGTPLPTMRVYHVSDLQPADTSPR
jgi:4-diphosphocytidyl-2-C-methyl-D-erythritol kinase